MIAEVELVMYDSGPLPWILLGLGGLLTLGLLIFFIIVLREKKDGGS